MANPGVLKIVAMDRFAFSEPCELNTGDIPGGKGVINHASDYASGHAICSKGCDEG